MSIPSTYHDLILWAGLQQVLQEIGAISVIEQVFTQMQELGADRAGLYPDIQDRRPDDDGGYTTGLNLGLYAGEKCLKLLRCPSTMPVLTFRYRYENLELRGSMFERVYTKAYRDELASSSSSSDSGGSSGNNNNNNNNNNH